MGHNIKFSMNVEEKPENWHKFREQDAPYLGYIQAQSPKHITAPNYQYFSEFRFSPKPNDIHESIDQKKFLHLKKLTFNNLQGCWSST